LLKQVGDWNLCVVIGKRLESREHFSRDNFLTGAPGTLKGFAS